ncbi:MAG: FlgD immunoglobulin-like domain containing protein [Bacteroidota bacterium]|nr:FlgD immunoglobulin-like domain containing protein [Bacteroidota bacterium]
MKNILSYILISLCTAALLIGGQEIESSDKQVLPSNLVDTLNIGLDPTVSTSLSPGDIMMGIYKAPGDLILNGIGIDVLGWNTDGTTPKLKIEVYRPGVNGYPFTSAGSVYGAEVIDQNGWIGYAHAAGNESVAYPDISSTSGLIWNNFSSGTGVCSAEPEVADGQSVMGTKVLPVGTTDVTITKPTNGATGIFYSDFTGEGSAQFVKDEFIAVVITYLTDGAGDPVNEATTIELSAVDASFFHPSPGLKYFASDCSGPSGEHGWHIVSHVGDFQYLVDVTGDIPPEIEIIHVGVSATEGMPDPIPPWTQIRVMATAIDQNPSGGPDGVEMVTLHWQLNSLTANVTSAAMMMAYNLPLQQYIYFSDILGQADGTIVYWWVSAEDEEGNISTIPKRSYPSGTVSTVDDISPNIFDLLGNYPNPFNPITTISYSQDNISDNSVTVYNLRGQAVKRLFIGRVNPGKHSVSWDGKNHFGQAMPSGIYIYRIQSNERILTGKMMLLK